MTYAIDANLLLYASDESSPLHGRALEILDQVALGPEIAYLFWPTIMAYLRIATHSAVFDSPLSHADALANMDALLQLPHVRTAGESEGFWKRFVGVARDVRPTGNLVPDAHLVSLMLDNGVHTIWTRDRDFRKFGGMSVRDPFAE